MKHLGGMVQRPHLHIGGHAHTGRQVQLRPELNGRFLARVNQPRPVNEHRLRDSKATRPHPFTGFFNQLQGRLPGVRQQHRFGKGSIEDVGAVYAADIKGCSLFHQHPASVPSDVQVHQWLFGFDGQVNIGVLLIDGGQHGLQVGDIAEEVEDRRHLADAKGENSFGAGLFPADQFELQIKHLPLRQAGTQLQAMPDQLGEVQSLDRNRLAVYIEQAGALVRKR
ncbi:hypothetical protein D3C71_1374990 [compost metagenome]